MRSKAQKVASVAVVAVVAAAVLAATMASAATGQNGSLAQTSAAALPTALSVASPQRAAGNFTLWGYRTNSWETWAIATQSPSWIKSRFTLVKLIETYVYAQAWVWRLTAQNARAMGRCLGVTWAGSGIIVGCSSS